MGYERKNIGAMDGYVPGKQPQEADALKLNTNENPYPPSPAVMSALRDIDPVALRRYPPPTADAFRDVAARTHGLSRDNIMAVNGSDELLRLAVTTFVAPGEPIGILEPSYSFYPVLAAIHDSPLVRVELAADYAWPGGPRALAERWNGAGVKLAMVVNPHAPSGRLESAQDVLSLARALEGVLLLDEAYVDFVDPACGYDCVPSIGQLPNLLLSRTFSKGYSLAGLRFGYALGPSSLIAPMLRKTRDVYNVNAISQRLARTALEHRRDAEASWQRVREQRARLTSELERRGLRSLPSEANFLLCRVPEPHDAAVLQQGLERAGILVRHFATERLRRDLRISIGTAEDNTRLLEALDALMR